VALASLAKSTFPHSARLDASRASFRLGDVNKVKKVIKEKLDA
jgi:hypothetical protein